MARGLHSSDACPKQTSHAPPCFLPQIHELKHHLGVLEKELHAMGYHAGADGHLVKDEVPVITGTAAFDPMSA